MADYIKRDTAYNYLTEYYNHRTDIQHQNLRKALNAIPSADVQPVVHGEWETEICDDGYGAYNLFVCSLCGSESAKRFNYCRECGARMDGTSNAR